MKSQGIQSDFDELWKNVKLSVDSTDLETLLKFGLFTGLIDKEAAQKEAVALIEKGEPFSSLLDLAIIAGRVDLNNFPIEFERQINRKDNLGLTPIFYAALLGDNGIDTIKFLADKGAITYRFKFDDELTESSKNVGIDSIFLRNSEVAIRESDKLGGTPFSGFNGALMDALANGPQKNIVILFADLDKQNSVSANFYSPTAEAFEFVKNKKVGATIIANIARLEAMVIRFLDEKTIGKKHNDIEERIFEKSSVSIANYFLMTGNLNALKNLIDKGFNPSGNDLNALNKVADQVEARISLEKMFANAGNQILETLGHAKVEIVSHDDFQKIHDESRAEFLEIYNRNFENIGKFFDYLNKAVERKQTSNSVKEELVEQVKIFVGQASINATLGKEVKVDQNAIIAKTVLSSMLKKPGLSGEEISTLKTHIDKIDNGEKPDLTSLKKSSEYKLLSSLLTPVVSKVLEANKSKSSIPNPKKGFFDTVAGWFKGSASETSESKKTHAGYSEPDQEGRKNKHIRDAELSVSPVGFNIQGTRAIKSTRIKEGVAQEVTDPNIPDPVTRTRSRTEEQVKIVAEKNGTSLKAAETDLGKV